MKKIVIKEVPKSKIRNKGVGDYRDRGSHLEILVARTKDNNFRKGVAIHELAEVLLVKKRGISLRKIDEFDRRHKDVKGEPGELPNAPYKKEHKVANEIEKILVKELKK